MRSYLLIFLLAGLLTACTPPPRPRRAPVTNAGINIVPDAILASEKMVPATQPADESRPDLIQVLSASRMNHEKIVRALRLSDLVPMLRTAGPYTLLAPTDEAFSKLPPGTFERLLLPANKARLQHLLQYHLLKGSIGIDQMLQTNGQVLTLSGSPVIIKGINNKVMINDVNVIQTETSPGNGVIHWIDGVLLPP